MKAVIKTLKAPQAIGPYVQGVTYRNLLFTSGQIGLDAEGTLVGKGIEEQSEAVMNNLRAVLEEGGSSMSNVIKTTCFLTDMDNFVPFNEIYAKHFEGLELPARSCVEVARLPKSKKVLVEVECVAFVNAKEKEAVATKQVSGKVQDKKDKKAKRKALKKVGVQRKIHKDKKAIRKDKVKKSLNPKKEKMEKKDSKEKRLKKTEKKDKKEKKEKKEKSGKAHPSEG